MTTEATPPSGPIVRDPILNTEVSPYLGADPSDLNAPIEGDRGDSADAAPPPPPPAAPPPPPEPTAEDDAAVVNGDEPPADETPPPAEPPKKEKSPIPYDRFKEVNDKKKAAEARAEQLAAELEALKRGAQPEKTEPAKPAYNFAEKEGEYIQLILDGQAEKAAALRNEIDTVRTQMLRDELSQKATETASSTLSREQTQQAIDKLAVQFSEQFPELDDTNEDFNEAAVEDVQAFYIGHLNKGVPPVKAFEKAVAAAAKVHGLVDRTATPPPKAEPKRDVGKKTSATVKQPPVPARGTSSGDAGAQGFDLANMTEADLAKLPPATLARLRGDFID